MRSEGNYWDLNINALVTRDTRLENAYQDINLKEHELFERMKT